MKRLFSFQTLLSAIFFILFLLCWLLFAPIQVGGQAYYVIINGNSMEPGFHYGDLVAVRAAPDYQIGDAVVYSYPGIGNVFHRIAATAGDHYLMKGDHNTWVDGYSPVKTEITGKFWFVIHGLGKWIIKLHTPWVFAILVAVIILIVGLSMGKQNKSYKKSNLNQISLAIVNSRETYFWMVCVIGIAAIMLGIFAFTQPLTTVSRENIPYQLNGSYNYSGSANQQIYDSDSIATGDPIYLNLGCTADFTFDYLFTSDSSFVGGGSYQLMAVLEGSNGWKRSFPITSPNQFSGNQFNAKGSVNFCSMRDLIKTTEAVTKVENLQYTLSIQPNVKITGEINQQKVDQSFNPILKFNLDSLQAYVLPNNDVTKDPFHPTQTGSVESDLIGPNSLSVFSLQIPVYTARVLAVILAFLALIGLIVPELLFAQSQKQNEEMKARILLGPRLINASGIISKSADTVIDLPSLESLNTLAVQMDKPVFLYKSPSNYDFLLFESDLIYRFRKTIEEGFGLR